MRSPSVKIEDGDSQTAQLIPNIPPQKSPPHPDLVTQSITNQRSDISTILVLKTARKWSITSHEAITRDDVEITSVIPTVQSPCVIMLVNGVAADGNSFEKLFTERDVHLASGPKLFGYWRRKRRGRRGRAHASGIPKDICHLLKILDERNGKLQVQFVGCDQNQTEWWESDKVKATYIELWDDWVQTRDDFEQESD